MKKKTQIDRRDEGSIYDKIIRENLQEIFMPLVAEKLKIKIKNFQPLPDKQETTLERETDAFLLIEPEEGENFILHLEFQVVDDHSMIYRMGEHHGIELRKYRIPLKHIVVYLGEKKPTMPTQLKPKEVFKAFELVDVHQFTPSKWLSSQLPSEIILAILAKYPERDAEKILQTILDRLRKVCKTVNELSKYVKQLIILSRLRALETLTIKITQDMPLLIDIEKDYLYQLGAKKERERLEKQLEKQKERARKEKAVLLKKQQEKARKEKAELLEKTKEILKAAKLLEKEKEEAAKLLEKEKEEAAKLLQKEKEEAARLRLEKINSITKMWENGVAKEMIAMFMGISLKQVNDFLKEDNSIKNKGL